MNGHLDAQHKKDLDLYCDVVVLLVVIVVEKRDEDDVLTHTQTVFCTQRFVLLS